MLLATVLCACTEIPGPAPEDVVPSQGGGDVGRPVLEPYAGPCADKGYIIARNTTVLYVPGAAAGSAVNFWPGVSMVASDTGYWRMETYAVGFPDELRSRERNLGTGANADLSSCVHCLVAYRGCDEMANNCQEGPFFPRAGLAVAAQVASAPGGSFWFELARVELVPGTIDESLHVTPAATDEGCAFFEGIIVGGRAATGGDCSLGYNCELAADAGNRHPD